MLKLEVRRPAFLEFTCMLRSQGCQVREVTFFQLWNISLALLIFMQARFFLFSKKFSSKRRGK